MIVTARPGSRGGQHSQVGSPRSTVQASTVAEDPGLAWADEGEHKSDADAGGTPMSRVDLAGRVRLGPKNNPTNFLGQVGIPAWGENTAPFAPGGDPRTTRGTGTGTETGGRPMLFRSDRGRRPQSARAGISATRRGGAEYNNVRATIGSPAHSGRLRPQTAAASGRAGRVQPVATDRTESETETDPDETQKSSGVGYRPTSARSRPRPPSSTTAAAAVRLAGRPLGSRPRFLREAEIPGGKFTRRRQREERPWTAGTSGGAGVGSRGQGLGTAWNFEAGQEADQLQRERAIVEVLLAGDDPVAALRNMYSDGAGHRRYRQEAQGLHRVLRDSADLEAVLHAASSPRGPGLPVDVSASARVREASTRRGSDRALASDSLFLDEHIDVTD